MSGARWTMADNAEVRRLAAAGMSHKEIARSLRDKSFEQVRAYCELCGITVRRRQGGSFEDTRWDLKAAKAELARQIALAKAEAKTAPLYRPRDLLI